MNLISVIIPTFQRAQEIEHKLQAYLSVLKLAANNTGASFECIVVDDNSSDGTFDLLKLRFGKSDEINLLQTTKNSGPGPARDVGVAVAQGRWIWFLDDDDALDPVQTTALFSELLQSTSDVEVMSHSLKHAYPKLPEKAGLELAKKVVAFRESQEVFRHVIRKSLLIEHQISFSQGFHEDIRYVIELMLRAKGVRVLQKSIVLKNKTDGAITARMNPQRIEGYIRAYNETRELLLGSVIGTPQLLQLFTVQSLGVLLHLVTRESQKAFCLSLLEHLKFCSRGEDAWSYDLTQLPRFGPQATNFEYVGFVWRSQIDEPTDTLLNSLRQVLNTRLSCKDLDSSIFLGPDEIRACCKRFFVNGIRKGDVVLLKADEQVDLQRIQSAKLDLISRINVGSAPECSGCPYIERRPISSRGIDYVSLENFAYCNMRCTYCSPKYYGGTEARYNAATIVSQLAELPGGFEPNCHVVWGGGEPTLSPRFDPINQSLRAILKSGKIRVLSNSLKYSINLEQQLKDARFQLVTSIDAGTEETFQIIRGKPGLNDVMSNLVRYQKVLDDPRRLTIKYIIGSTNYSTLELQAFVEQLEGSSLLNSLFQISCDFTLDAPQEDLIFALYELSLRLLKQGARFVFFDDLVRDRVRITPELAHRVRQHISRNSLDEQYLLRPDSALPVVLWGTGMQAQWLSLHTLTGKTGCIVGTVKNGDDFCKTYLYNSDEPTSNVNQIVIFPAGVQSIYEIIRNIEEAELGELLFRGVML